MNNFLGNPFLVTKAFHLSDEQILEYWTDIGKNTGGFKNMLKPTNTMPIYILGGKGSGKTHLMRYFSYSSQMLRLKGDINKIIDKEKYVGIYSLFSGLDSTRFIEKGFSEDKWKPIFEYYFELWLTTELLIILQNIIKKVSNINEFEFCTQISKLFDIYDNTRLNSLQNIVQYISDLIQEINIAVNNNKLENITIRVTRGRLIFGIPQLFINSSSLFNKVIFVYFLDEFEKLEEYQQKYINTLVWERKNPCSFRIGSRLYGIRTNETYYKNDRIKIGSEYKQLILDEELRRDERKYMLFAKKMCLKRLHAKGYITKLNDKNILKKLDNFFVKYEEKDFLENIKIKYIDKELPHIKNLRTQLTKHFETNKKVNEQSTHEIVNEIINNLKNENAIFEKINILYFYIFWNRSGDNLLKSSAKVKKEFEKYKINIKLDSRYKTLVGHYRNDMLAQLQRDLRGKVFYTGLNTFIEMSWGLPRNLLIILNEIFEKSLFNDEKPFVDENKISIESQNLGVLESSRWFEDDSNVGGTDGEIIFECYYRLVKLMRDIRYSDKPSECSISSFNVELSLLTLNSKKVLDLMEKYSILIEIRSRKNKNYEKIKKAYQINRMLAPLWGLPLSRRGVIEFNHNLANSIFDKTHFDVYENNKNKLISSMNAPFKPIGNIKDYSQIPIPGL